MLRLISFPILLFFMMLFPIQLNLLFTSAYSSEQKANFLTEIVSSVNIKPLPKEIQSLLDSTKGKDLNTRIDILSAFFIGAPYKRFPIGEGEPDGVDQKPLYRFDCFDCSTYIETVMALAYAENHRDFYHHLIQLRYSKGTKNFFTRNHFPSIDWIPNNIRKGYLQDITNTMPLSKTLLRQIEFTIDKRKWLLSLPLRRLGKERSRNEIKRLLRLEATKQKTIQAYLPVIDVKLLYESARETSLLTKKIPSGAIINVIGQHLGLESLSGSPLNVIHQGIVIRKNGQLFFRHASSGDNKKVMDLAFGKYLNRLYYLDATGINILSIKKPDDLNM